MMPEGRNYDDIADVKDMSEIATLMVIRLRSRARRFARNEPVSPLGVASRGHRLTRSSINYISFGNADQAR